MVLPTTAMLDLIRDTLDAIKPIPLLRFETAQAHLDSLTKPPGSLGLLEDLAKKYTAIRDTDHPSVNRKSVVVFAADHASTSTCCRSRWMRRSCHESTRSASDASDSCSRRCGYKSLLSASLAAAAGVAQSGHGTPPSSGA